MALDQEFSFDKSNSIEMSTRINCTRKNITEVINKIHVYIRHLAKKKFYKFEIFLVLLFLKKSPLNSTWSKVINSLFNYSNTIYMYSVFVMAGPLIAMHQQLKEENFHKATEASFTPLVACWVLNEINYNHIPLHPLFHFQL